MTKQELDEIEARSGYATSGQWRYETHGNDVPALVAEVRRLQKELTEIGCPSGPGNCGPCHGSGIYSDAGDLSPCCDCQGTGVRDS